MTASEVQIHNSGLIKGLAMGGVTTLVIVSVIFFVPFPYLVLAMGFVLAAAVLAGGVLLRSPNASESPVINPNSQQTQHTNE